MPTGPVPTRPEQTPHATLYRVVAAQSGGRRGKVVKSFRYASLLSLATLSRVRSKVAGPHCLGFLTEANGMYLIAAATDCGVGRRLAFDGSYDTGPLETYRRLITPD